MEKIIKKIIIIKGKKVQDVGYRLFLLDLADSESVPYLNAKNKEDIDEDSNEIVEVFVGGEEKQINNLVESIQDFENNKPKKAIVKSIEVVDNDYKGSIRTTESFSRWLSNNQLFKIAEAGTIMISKHDIMIYKQDQMIGKQDETIQEIRDMRSD